MNFMQEDMQLDAQMCDMLVKCNNFAYKVHIMNISFYNSICVVCCYVRHNNYICLHILHSVIYIMLPLVHSA